MLFDNKKILAPTVRCSTLPLRSLCLKYGADIVFSPEIIDYSIINCDRVINENNLIQYKTISRNNKKLEKQVIFSTYK